MDPQASPAPISWPRLGYKPVVFEAEPRPGGMLVQTIPAYRLPRETVAREIRMIEQMGVEIRTEHRLGRDFTLQSLKDEGYEAVFLGIGIPGGITLELPGSSGPDVVDGISFLKEYNLRGSVRVGKKVVIIGGGNAATDAARTAVRLGAEVHMVYRRSQAEMPAYAEEIEQAMQEGVMIHTLTHPVQIHREGEKIVSVECSRMELGDFDRSGRRVPWNHKIPSGSKPIRSFLQSDSPSISAPLRQQPATHHQRSPNSRDKLTVRRRSHGFLREAIP